jgi:hypothetical protein
MEMLPSLPLAPHFILIDGTIFQKMVCNLLFIQMSFGTVPESFPEYGFHIFSVSIPRQSRGLYDCWPLKGGLIVTPKNRATLAPGDEMGDVGSNAT